MFDSVRVRLTAWYVFILALVLTVFSVGAYVQITRTLYERFDADLKLSLESAAVRLVDEIAAGSPYRLAAQRSLDELSTFDSSAIFANDGTVLDEQSAPGDPGVSLPSGQLQASDILLITINQKYGQRRVIARRIDVPGRGSSFTIVISRSFESVDSALRGIRRIFLLGVFGALLISTAGGWFLSKRSLSPVVAMSNRARRIGAENLSERLPVANSRDELGRLAETFNELLARLDTSFALQRRFMADASHELRTPVSVIRTASEVTLEMAERPEGDYRDALRIIDEQAKRLSRLVDDMFTLARGDVGSQKLDPSDFYLDEIVTEAVRAARILAERKGVSVELPELHETPYFGDEGLVRQMLLNLLDNAVKYTDKGGTVEANLTRVNGAYFFSVSDTGIGIPETEQSLIFDRFYRVNPRRAKQGGAPWGAGLGLSIARWIAEAHGGKLYLRESSNRGSRFEVELPADRI
jgi:two-component system OmpR family sensor kinase